MAAGPSEAATSPAAQELSMAPIRDRQREAVITILDRINERSPGRKALVIDPELSGPLATIVSVAALREHGIEHIYHLQPGRLDTECDSVIYFTRQHPEAARCIASHVANHHRAGQPKMYYMMAVPRFSLVMEKALEMEGVSDLPSYDCPVVLFPYDDDVLSVEREGLRGPCLDGDRTSYHALAEALVLMRETFGPFGRSFVLGVNAKIFLDDYTSLAQSRQLPATGQGEFDDLIVLDRSLDLVTPMFTQLTYEGMIDEVFYIKHGCVELEPEYVPNSNGRASKVPLNSSDRAYVTIRDKHVSAVGDVVRARLKTIGTGYDKRHQLKSITEIKQFMGTFKDLNNDHKQLAIHVSILERMAILAGSVAFKRKVEIEQRILAGSQEPEIAEFILSCIVNNEPAVDVLRLAVLWCAVNNGLREQFLNDLKTAVIEKYGVQHVVTFHHMEANGLLKIIETKPNFPIVRTTLNLWMEEVDEKTPKDMSYVYSGYAPLSCRLVQYALRASTWKSIDAVVKILTSFHRVEPPFKEGAKDKSTGAKTKRKRVLVVYVGGVTRAELSSLRFLTQQSGGPTSGPPPHYVVLTTSIITGTSLLDPFIFKPDLS